MGTIGSDLIKSFKIINSFVNYGHSMFGKNTACQTRNLKVRVIKYWNQLPQRARYSTSINAFKAGLDHFKLCKPDSPNGSWELSEQICNRISEHVNYLLANRDVAMRQNIVLILSLSCFFIAY